MATQTIIQESTLYEAAKNYSVNLAQDWQKFDGKFAYIDNTTAIKITQLALTASNLPDQEQRLVPLKNLTITKDALSNTVRADYQRLKCYIEKAFPTTATTQLSAAGSHLYKSAKSNLSKLLALIDKMKEFVTNNMDTLMDNGGMPVGFDVQINQHKLAVDDLIFRRITVKKGVENDKKAKDTANKALYNAMMEVSKAAAQAFKHDELMLNAFIFDRVIHSIEGTKAAKVTGYLLDEMGKGIANIEVKIIENGRHATTDKKGYFIIPHLKADVYTMQFTSGATHRHQPVTVNVPQGKTIRVKETILPMGFAE